MPSDRTLYNVVLVYWSIVNPLYYLPSLVVRLVMLYDGQQRLYHPLGVGRMLRGFGFRVVDMTWGRVFDGEVVDDVDLD